MNSATFLLLNLALAFYNVGTIWAHEVDIFRSWKLVPGDAFHRVQGTHWEKVRYWVFLPVGLALAGTIVLVWYHPTHTPLWAVWSALGFQVASHALTAAFWGRWQARLSRDPAGPASLYLARILRTHWIRTALISFYGISLLICTVESVGRQ